MRQPLVTVLVPAYNAEATIRRALDSVFRQNYQPIEVLVIDDASTDRTADLVRGYSRSEIRLVSLSRNVGVCGAMNRGLEEAQGEFVAFLDADDEWLEGKLAKQLPLIMSNPRMSWVSCGCLFVDEAGRPLREFGLHPPDLPPDQIWRKLLAATCVAKPCVVARRSVLASVGRFDPSLAVGEDQDMWIRLALAGEVGFVPEIMVKAYDTPDSLTKKYANRIAEYVLPMVERHIAAQRARLSDAEVRHIRGERYTMIGRNLYRTGESAKGFSYIVRAIAKGNHLQSNLWYLLTAAPPSRWLKERFVGTRHIG